MVEYLSLLLLTVALPKIKISFKKVNELSLQSSTNIRGILCVLIFLNHFSSWFENQGIIYYLFSHLGSFVVGVFFFLSGFGLMKAYPREVKLGFLIKRFLKLMIPYWICEALYAVISVCFNIPLHVDVNLKNIALALIQRSEIVENSWYVGASLVLYIVYFCAKKFLPKLKTSLKITILLVLFSLIFRSIEYWTTFFAFPLGVLFCENEKGVNTMKGSRKILCFASSTLLCAAVIGLKYYAYSLNNSMLMNASDMVTSVTFAAVAYFVFSYVRIGNFALSFLGKISYEFYLLHGLGIRIAFKLVGIENSIAFLLCSLAFTLIMSYLTNLVSSQATKPIIQRIV